MHQSEQDAVLNSLFCIILFCVCVVQWSNSFRQMSLSIHSANSLLCILELTATNTGSASRKRTGEHMQIPTMRLAINFQMRVKNFIFIILQNTMLDLLLMFNVSLIECVSFMTFKVLLDVFVCV